MTENQKEDGPGNPYFETIMHNGEKIRVTRIGESWRLGASVRIQNQETSGHLMQGPEILISNLGEVKELFLGYHYLINV